MASVSRSSLRRLSETSYDRWTTTSPCPDGGWQGEPAPGRAQFQVGARTGTLSVSWPPATLTIDPMWANVRVRGLALGSGNVCVRREEVVSIVGVRAIVSKGIFFETVTGALDGLIVWTSRSTLHQALEVFSDLGWPVADTRADGP